MIYCNPDIKNAEYHLMLSVLNNTRAFAIDTCITFLDSRLDEEILKIVLVDIPII